LVPPLWGEPGSWSACERDVRPQEQPPLVWLRRVMGGRRLRPAPPASGTGAEGGWDTVHQVRGALAADNWGKKRGLGRAWGGATVVRGGFQGAG